jgi:hypothetical protein
MEKVNACIISFFMKNIDKKTVDLQHAVVDKFNPSKHPHYAIQTDLRHGASIDLAWKLNGIDHPTFRGHNVPKRFDHDVILFLDIDALPLNDFAIDDTISKAANGKLIGNVQRSNHIQNDQHLFVAPSVLAVSVESFTFNMGMPSATETRRADVAEEYTFAAEKCGTVPIEFYMPLGFDESPAECPSWALKDGMPVYGRGTTFGKLASKGLPSGGGSGGRDVPLFWHQFQSFHPGQQEKFWKKCESMLTVTEVNDIIEPRIVDLLN